MGSYICKKVEEQMQQILQAFKLEAQKENWKPKIIDILTDLHDEIKKNCVMLIVYFLYCEFSEKHSVRFYIKNILDLQDDSPGNPNSKLDIWLDKLNKSMKESSNKVERDMKEYDHSIYTYRVFRTEKDEFAKIFFANSDFDFKGLYKTFESTNTNNGDVLEKLSGQELQYITFLETVLIENHPIIDLVRRAKFYDNKNLSHAEFEIEYLSQIKNKNSGLYYDMKFSKLFKKAGIFFQTLNFFKLEANCHFERNYCIANTLSSVKLSKEIKKNEKNILAHINYFFNPDTKYQDYMVLGYEKILSQYNYESIDAADIYDIFNLCNYVINTVAHKILEEEIDKKMYDDELNILNDFFENYIGQGQHIFEKDFSATKTRDFRDLYRPVKY